MTIVSGKIESLKRLQRTLNANGITRFNSIGDINRFIKGYELERGKVPEKITASLDNEIKKIKEEMQGDIRKSNKGPLHKVVYWLKIVMKRSRYQYLENNYEEICSRRCDASFHEIDFTKKLIDDLYTVIAGAVGENAVVSELKKLSDDYYLINDFSIRFDPPIYNKKKRDRIFTIQVDHLLVSQSGVFVIEAKNWSKASVNNLDLRSPVEQILRVSYALFVFLNAQSQIGFLKHHWGRKKIPIRNIIVMTRDKPAGAFNHVKVLPISELNGYVQYFDSVFSGEESKSVYEYLKGKSDSTT